MVVIGMDPHKRSATIEVLNRSEDVLDEGRLATDTTGYRSGLLRLRLTLIGRGVQAA